MIEVHIENFQSIASTTLTIDGFTVLVGRSNIGKSAIVRAVRNALTGASGTDFVRHGASCERALKDSKKCKCFTVVRITTPAIKLTWEKGDAVNRYTIQRQGGDPVLYDKVERGTPDFLRPEFTPIKVGDAPTLIQISEQFNPIFLLGETGSVAADVLSDVARLDDINEAIRLVTKDRKEASTTRTVRERDVAEVVKELAVFDGLDFATQRAREVETRFDGIKAKQAEVDNARRFVLELEALARSIRGLQAATQPQPPDDEAIRTASKALEALTRFEEDLRSRQAAVDRLTGVESVEVPSTDALQGVLDRFVHADRCLRKMQAIKVDFERSKVLATLKDPDLDALLAANERLRTVDALARRSATLTATVETLESSLSEAEREEAAALEDLNALGMCPTCTQPIGAGHQLHLEAS